MKKRKLTYTLLIITSLLLLGTTVVALVHEEPDAAQLLQHSGTLLDSAMTSLRDTLAQGR